MKHRKRRIIHPNRWRTLKRYHSKPSPTPKSSSIFNTSDTHEIKNAMLSLPPQYSLVDMLKAASNALKAYSAACFFNCIFLILSFIYPWIWPLTIAYFCFCAYICSKSTINLDNFSLSEHCSSSPDHIHYLLPITHSKKVWYINQTSKIINPKYNSGAINSIKRSECHTSTTVPYPFLSDMEVVTFSLGNEQFIFLPNNLILIQDTQVNVLDYSSVTISIHPQRFVESEVLPKDANVVDYTWQYVNKSGEPDKRFKQNKRYPICLYGELEIKSYLGINTIIMFSNYHVYSKNSTQI